MFERKGEKNPMYGRHHTEKTKKRISEAQIGKIIYKETRDKLSETRKRLFREGKISSPTQNKGHSESSKKKISETRKQLFKEGKIIPWSKGKQFSEKHRKNIGLARIGKHYPKLSETKRGETLGEKNPFYGKHHKIEAIEKNRLIHQQLWKDQEWKEKTMKNALKGLMKRPTSYEQKIIALCAKYNLPFKYVGNGEVIIAGKNPDFIESNGRKLLIEPHCRFFNFYNPNYEKRAEAFAKHGYRTLFLYDEDLHCRNWEEICISKITDFMEEPHG